MTLSRLQSGDMKGGLSRHNIIDLHSISKVQFLRNKINITGDIISKMTCRYGRFLSQENNDQSEIINIILLSSILSSSVKIHSSALS